MADINKNNLLYVPKIEPERNYKSDGSIPKENPIPVPLPEEPITDTPKDIYNDLAEVQELITLTGVPTLEFFNETIERLKKRLIVAFPTGEPPEKQKGTEPPIPRIPPLDSHTTPTPLPPDITPPSSHVVNPPHSTTLQPGENTPEGGTPSTYTPPSLTPIPETPTIPEVPMPYIPYIPPGTKTNTPTQSTTSQPGTTHIPGSTPGKTSTTEHPPLEPQKTKPGETSTTHKPSKTPTSKDKVNPFDPTRTPTSGTTDTTKPWYVDRDFGPDIDPITGLPIEHEVETPDEFGLDDGHYTPDDEQDIIEHHIYGTVEEVEEPTIKPIEVPNMYPNITNVVLDVVPPRSLVQIIQDNYARDTINLQNFYLQKLQLILQKYFQEMLTIMAECNVDDIDKLTQEFDGEYVTVGNPNMRHLRDSVCRSQIMRDQKERFIKKMFNVDNTMLHMNRWHVAEQEREAYYAESYGDSGSFLDSHANAILRDCRTQYDAAYNQSVYDMYKYLNSSCEALGDVLEMTSKEAQAKGQMLKNGIDIYKNKAAEEQKAEDQRRADNLKELQAQREANKEAKPMSMSGGKISKTSHVSLEDSNKLNLSGYESGGGGGASSGGAGGGTCSSAQVEKAVQIAIQLGSQGFPYVWGAGGPDRFDCTGFVSYAFNQAGFPISVCHGTTFDNAFLNAGFEQIPFSGGDYSQLQRGDVLSNDHHVELYIGNGQQVGAHSTASGVNVTNFWTQYSWDCIFRYKG